MYNLTTYDNQTDIASQFLELNAVSNGFIAMTILLTLFVILVIAFRRFGFVESLVGSGGIMTIVTILFWSIGIVPTYYIIFPIILLGGGLITIGVRQ